MTLLVAAHAVVARTMGDIRRSAKRRERLTGSRSAGSTQSAHPWVGMKRSRDR